MKIEELLNPKLAILNLQANDKDSAIREMADMMADQGIVNNEEELRLVLVMVLRCLMPVIKISIKLLSYLPRVKMELILNHLMVSLCICFS